MHGSYQDFVEGIAGFLGGYYLTLAAMNAYMAFYLWHHRHKVGQACFWVAVSFALVAVGSAAMGGSPPGWPAWLRNAVNEATGPVIYSLGTTTLLLIAYFARRFLVQPMVGWALLNLSLVIMGLSMADSNFAAIVTKPDNVPIVGLVFLLGFFTWLATAKAVDNDDRLKQGLPPREKLDNEKVLVWPDLVYTELICMIALTAFLVVWGIALQAPLEEPASSVKTPNPSKAPWYFLGLQEMLVYYDPWMAGVVLPSLIIVGLMAIPFLDFNKQGNGYYTIEQRKFSYLIFQFGFLEMWVTLIILGTFFRGPNWNIFGPFEYWDPHKVLALNNVDLSQYFWVKGMGQGLPKAPPGSNGLVELGWIAYREAPGIILLALYFIALPPLMATTIFRGLFVKMGFMRFMLMSNLLLFMAALPLKMVLRWTLNLKYIVSIPEYFLNFQLFTGRAAARATITMPANEQTWRDSKLLHVVFGISSLAMLGTTVWMLAADHRREWKDYQRTFQRVEAWNTQARISQQESKAYEEELAKAKADLEAARKVVPDRAVIDRFEDAVAAEAERRDAPLPDFKPIDDAYAALANAEADARPPLWDRLRGAMGELIKRARFHEDQLATNKKFLAADLEVARSQYDIGVGNELPNSELKELQKKVNDQIATVATAIDEMQNATSHRKHLESIQDEMTADEIEAKKRLDEQQGKLAQLEKALYERENHVMKEVAELPILDAFGRPIKIEQIWLPKLTINYNFGAVGDIARFDRCITCHQAMDQTAPGSAVEPRYKAQHSITLSMETPAEPPKSLAEKTDDVAAREKTYVAALEEAYGLELAARGLFHGEDAMVSVVRPQTPAAKARLQMGDVIEQINDVKILSKGQVYNYLLESVRWGQPVNVTVRRGVPNPYASHPRLDLYMGSLSPHKMAEIGCTVCHDGQGSGTAFKWASHSPDDPLEAARWKRQYGWFDNHHWIFPMTPHRFTESMCLKCHHDVTELEPSQRFPDPPAPKLVEGFTLIKEFGCFGCHEISGFDGPNKRVGPDLRTEPYYSAASLALLAGGGLTPQQKEWAEELSRQPGSDATRRKLTQSLLAQETLPGDDPEATKKLLHLLDELETPGKLRRVGPSLRHVASKNDFKFLYSWIRQPSDFRPTTKMPQFFGQYDHLDGKGLEESQRFEPIEIRSAAEFLLAKSQPFEFTPPPKSVTAKASADRGKELFETRGCLACHQHSEFPAGAMKQGPDLSRIGAKFAGEDRAQGEKWLYTWLRNPSKYHVRTLMPNLFLEPIEDADGKLTDPAADIGAFLLGSTQDWTPQDVPARELDDDEKESLRALALEHLRTAFTRRQAEQILDEGIPEERKSELKGDEVELLGPMSVEKQMQYVGRRTISKYGCSGCHDIPKFEDAKPIGTGLADWGRKTADKLAFEQITEYMKLSHGHAKRWEPVTHGDVTDEEMEESDEGQYGHMHMDFKDLPPDAGYFMEKLFGHQREGFIWQKLREPRSYDYKKTQNKGYNERLRMPKFTALNDEQREAIITFVLGLVSEPPAPQYVYRASPRASAITQGLEVIEKFNCTGCHALQMDRWKLSYEPGDFPDPPEISDFSFLQAHFTPEQVKASLATDDAGMLHATITGMPAVDAEGRLQRYDEDGAPVEADDTETKASYSFVPFDNVLLNGQARQSGYKFLVPESRVVKRYPQVGGFLARLAYPTVLAAEKAVNPNVVAEEAWGWLPPPLVGEGRKVQSAWLYDFLLDPYPIRPSVVLRMPKFNMSPSDATKLVNYFAAIDGADYPYNFDPRTRDEHLETTSAKYPKRLNDALKIITDANYCTKCHLLGDFTPKGSVRAKAPQLDRVYKRMRPDYLLDWIANPKRLLPYTGMPVNIPHDKGVSQDLFHGTPVEQLNGVVDLLMNFDRFMESQTPIAPMIKPATPEAAEAPAASAGAQASGPAQ